MRLLGFDCGCDDRKHIMFTQGNLGMAEAAIVVAAIVAVVTTAYYHRKVSR